MPEVYEFFPLPEINEAHFDRIFDFNLKGLLFTTQAATNAFGDRGGSGGPATSVYSATKAAGRFLHQDSGLLTRSEKDSGQFGPAWAG